MVKSILLKTYIENLLVIIKFIKYIRTNTICNIKFGQYYSQSHLWTDSCLVCIQQIDGTVLLAHTQEKFLQVYVHVYKCFAA